MKAIFTAEVNCRDCHKCVRICPVKAIGIENGHAALVEDSCIHCGHCVLECPRSAKQIINQTDRFREAKQRGKKVVLSIAPSFVSAFPEYSYKQILKMLHRAGFNYVQETAVGAEIVSYAYKREIELSDKPLISACCPVVISLIEKYYPTLVENISPTRSPMLVHVNMLREKYGSDVFVVFAGPCIGKFYEAEAYPEDIDMVMTFEQLKDILERVKYAVDDPDEEQEERDAHGNARFFPVRGGIIKSFMSNEETDPDIFSVSGIDGCMEMFDNLLKGEIKPRFIEAMACQTGCIAGPGMPKERRKCRPVNRMNVIKFATLSPPSLESYEKLMPKIKRKFRAQRLKWLNPSEEEIRAILIKIGKSSIEDEQNCGACGYNSCREKAIATFRGLAEPNMCIPYMRSKAESFANLVVDSSMDAIVVINNSLQVQEFNKIAEQFFAIPRKDIIGKSLQRVIDCADIIEAIGNQKRCELQARFFAEHNRALNVRIMPNPEQSMTVVIFKDVTDLELQKQELLDMKRNTIDKATSIINKQMSVAQEIAGLLGETTAETKAALLALVKVLDAKGDK